MDGRSCQVRCVPGPVRNVRNRKSIFGGGRWGTRNGTSSAVAPPMCSFLASTLMLLLRLQHINFFLQLRGPDYTGTCQHGGFTYVHNLLHMTGSFLHRYVYNLCVVGSPLKSILTA